MKNGELAILNCSDGDTRITFDSNNPDEIERARHVVEDMLRRGYCIAVEVGGKMERASGFDASQNAYVVTSSATPILKGGAEAEADEPKETGRKAPARRGNTSRVPARGTRAVAVAPTAGGGFGASAFGVFRSQMKNKSGSPVGVQGARA